MKKLVIYEKKERIAYITINRPEVRNAQNNQTKNLLAKVWVDFRDDPEVWVAIISGAGGEAFSAGADLKERVEWHASHTEPFVSADQPLQYGEIQLYKPIIAAIDGWCIGGGLELALATDIRIATEHSRFGLMEPKIGAVAGACGPIRLPNQVPFAVAMEMLLTADPIDAKRAYEIGLINQVVPSSEELLPAAQQMAARILANAPLTIRVTKEQAFMGFNLPSTVALPLRDVGMLNIRTSEDYKVGSKAFAQKTKPVWKGR